MAMLPTRAWLAAAMLACLLIAPAAAGAAPLPTRIAYAPGQIVPIPAAIPHEEGDMVDRRILPNLRWIAKRFPIYVTDGYSGRLPDGSGRAGCDGCHTTGSDHHNGLAVDIVPVNGSGRCDGSWRAISRLARWAEPRQNQPRPPFRWVGYDGDAGHGCGHHLHLSWEHAAVAEFRLAEWVEVFAVGRQGVAQKPKPQPKPKPGQPSGLKPPKGPQGGSEPGVTYERGPHGGFSASSSQSGGVSARGD